MSVGSNIKKRRYELKMSQQDLANAMGYKTRSTIAKIESGENDVSQKKLIKFADALDTSIEALISGYSYENEKITAGPKLLSEKNNKNVVIILAGGKSSRNRQNIPSQFINVHGKPIIMYSLEVYQKHPSIDDIYIVCLKGWETIVDDYAKQYGITKLKGLILAGNSGIESFRNGYEHIRKKYSRDDVVIIQEATRPLISEEEISRLLQTCSEKGSATLCHSMKEYVQFEKTVTGVEYIDRDSVIALQSPEAHSLSLMDEIFEVAEKFHHPLLESCFTMLLYNLGYDINFIESTTNNIKIVREEDLVTFGVLVV